MPVVVSTSQRPVVLMEEERKHGGGATGSAQSGSGAGGRAQVGWRCRHGYTGAGEFTAGFAEGDNRAPRARVRGAAVRGASPGGSCLDPRPTAVVARVSGAGQGAAPSPL